MAEFKKKVFKKNYLKSDQQFENPWSDMLRACFMKLSDSLCESVGSDAALKSLTNCSELVCSDGFIPHIIGRSD